jgi:hypothetical protein
LVVALLTLALMTHGAFLHPTENGLFLAAQVVQARHQQAALAEQNRQLQRLYQYLQTPAGKDLAARSEVMALKPGERLIVLSEAAQKAQQPPTVAGRVQNGLQTAGKYVDYGREVLAAYSRMGVSPAEAATVPSDSGRQAAPDN